MYHLLSAYRTRLQKSVICLCLCRNLFLFCFLILAFISCVILSFGHGQLSNACYISVSYLNDVKAYQYMLL